MVDSSYCQLTAKTTTANERKISHLSQKKTRERPKQRLVRVRNQNQNRGDINIEATVVPFSCHGTKNPTACGSHPPPHRHRRPPLNHWPLDPAAGVLRVDLRSPFSVLRLRLRSGSHIHHTPHHKYKVQRTNVRRPRVRIIRHFIT
jgi:hypothetical protein